MAKKGMVYVNQTRIPDDVLIPLLKAAARAVGLGNMGGVVVRIASGRNRARIRSHGDAGDLPRDCKRVTDLKLLLGCNAQYGAHRTCFVRLILPSPWTCSPRVLMESIGESVYNTAVHEFYHALEHVTPSCDALPASWNGHRRRRWADRPEERRANQAVEYALERERQGRLASRHHLRAALDEFYHQVIVYDRGCGEPKG